MVITQNMSLFKEVQYSRIKKSSCCVGVQVKLKARQRRSRVLFTTSMSAPNTAPYGSTGGAEVLLACRYLILALSSLVSVY
ncbi:neuronal growth regulator 1-like isoform X1 [Labeo rohita]|uniref:Neuronal growth regulator 1-like isoform X1 n=1 Tax=Labeo rohita TaxID=84645 RepID=A0A498LJJ1_LABRO|nr:neuronal growth regulator 1-like isoform X1 [Labeo rohita]RXN07992.1 neuronal growth regulator 1-like isoform X1 [Labeo rohita]